MECSTLSRPCSSGHYPRHWGHHHTCIGCHQMVRFHETAKSYNRIMYKYEDDLSKGFSKCSINIVCSLYNETLHLSSLVLKKVISHLILNKLYQMWNECADWINDPHVKGLVPIVTLLTVIMFKGYVSSHL